MAHEIEFNSKTGTHSFVSAKNMKPWHGLGQLLPDTFLTAEQCIKHANLDYTVALQKAQITVGKQTMDIPGAFGTYRTDTNQPLGVVGTRYTVVQNTEAFAFFDSIIGGSEAIYETAGVLGNGEVVFITAKMPDYIKVGKDDLTEVYVVLRMNHDGKGAVKAMITPIRVVCANTLRMAISEAVNTVSIKHTTNASIKLAEAGELLGVTHKYVTEANEILNQLTKRKVSDKAFKELVSVLFPSSNPEMSTRMANKHDSILEYYHSGPGQKEWMGTAYGAYNAITGYYGNVADYKSADARFINIMDTTGALNSQKAFDWLLKNSN